jgi:hypothetical protein
VDRHAQPGGLAGAGDQLAEGGRGHRPELTNCAGLTHKRTNEEHRLIAAVGKR